MQDNPYQPPVAPLIKPQPADGTRRKRFRFRYVPATLCFFYGGIGLVALVFLNVVILAFVKRTGSASVNFGPLLLIEAAMTAYFATWIFSGRLWLQGRWLYAVTTVVMILGVGLAFDRATSADGERGGSSRMLFNRIIRRQ
jgi:hypothetical protein